MRPTTTCSGRRSGDREPACVPIVYGSTCMANQDPAQPFTFVDLQFDDCNCGYIGLECPPGTVCVDGVCLPLDPALQP